MFPISVVGEMVKKYVNFTKTEHFPKQTHEQKKKTDDFERNLKNKNQTIPNANRLSFNFRIDVNRGDLKDLLIAAKLMTTARFTQNYFGST